MKAALALLPALALLLATASRAALPDLTPLVANYRITVNGIPAGTAARVEVRALGGTRHETSFKVENRFFTHHEVSRFDWQACSVTAREYRHEFHGLGIDRQSAIDFDWSRHVAVESRGDSRRELPLTTDIYDGLNMAMLARCRLRDGARSLDFPVLYRGERRDMQFSVTGHENVETPLGTFNALVLERSYTQRLKRTRVWVAPDLDWLMIRFEHVENPAARGSLLLTSVQVGDGRPAAVPPAPKPTRKEKREAKKREQAPVTTTKEAAP